MRRSRAKTAYGVLGEVMRLIEEEPRRYNQQDVLFYLPKDESERLPSDPPCGTIGCVAGWVHTLTSSRRLAYPSLVLQRAARVLGLNHHLQAELFGGSAVGGTPQTKAHAKNGVRHIAAFRERYKELLLAQRIRGR